MNMMTVTGWETSARLVTNASENLAGWMENRPGQVEFSIGYIRDYQVRVSAKTILSFPACVRQWVYQWHKHDDCNAL